MLLSKKKMLTVEKSSTVMVNKDTADAKTLQEKITAMREGGKILGNLLRDIKIM